MAATINQARSALSKMFNSERYSHFTLQSDEEGDEGSHVEVRLSDDEVDDHAPSEQVGQPGGSPSYRPRPQQNNHKVCYLALGTLFIFIIGYLIGYVSHHSPRKEPITCDSEQEVGVAEEAVVESSLSWNDITSLLAQRLTPDAFNSRLSDVEQTDHVAGSSADGILEYHVFDSFKSLEMEPWTDVHYVQLQTANSQKPNRVMIGQEEVGQPKGYLAYSATGKAQGKAVYGNYGSQEDLMLLQNLKVELNGTVILLRATGQISLAQQVANVAALGVSAVLIYLDPKDYRFQPTTELYGHVHLGSGDPFTPGFPSFNHTQFPPTQSSGLPTVLAQSITAASAAKILTRIGGLESPLSFKGSLDNVKYTLGGASSEDVTVEVNNVLQDTEIHNVFGVIKGFTEPDRYVLLGAQRDAWGPGYAKATVGTTLLLELARAVSEMVHTDGFRPRRSLVFASWSAGEYGSVGATEWLEGFFSSLDRRAFTYISLDGVVTGHGEFKVSASPLLYSLLESTMKEVKNPIGFGESGKSLYDKVSGVNFEKAVFEPMKMEDSAYPFLAFSGIPSLSFRFVSQGSEAYPYYGTSLDNKDHLGYATAHRLNSLATGAGLVAGQLALRLVHDHVLRLDVQRYRMVLSQSVVKINQRLKQVTRDGSAESLSARWLIMALGSYSRAATDLNTDLLNTDLTDTLACHNINDRIMRVEHNLLSPYVSPKEVPFRHLLFGRGSHTLAALLEGEDREVLRTQLALATWTLQGCANALSGDVWDSDNQM
ncbi:transferrin receptor protein 1 [Oncorhynchus tshawytscha]|uniref:Transferrin receptor protein 1 n=1 Tax=Oncorhynchus tshawytscha TaxID=74940 RepID=A0A8C8ETM3_ONCTS|nr:transferrin receptor protein 1 [Oncorhynchus tshawytscha]XP_042164490.1 transferrin receptor protein 1 [Oncorhynchus tshawytscha]